MLSPTGPDRYICLSSITLAQGIEDLSSRDPALAGVIDQYGPPPLWLRRPGFASLVRIILEQQVSLASAAAAYQRLQKAVGRVTPHQLVMVSPARLHRAGITRQKSRFCQELARQLISGTLDLRALAQLSDREVTEQLVKVPGIGPWTADIYLLMLLGRPDIWPMGDVALATAVWRLMQLDQRPGYQQLAEMATAWAPWRAVAARILWHYYLSARRQGHWNIASALS